MRSPMDPRSHPVISSVPEHTGDCSLKVGQQSRKGQWPYVCPILSKLSDPTATNSSSLREQREYYRLQRLDGDCFDIPNSPVYLARAGDKSWRMTVDYSKSHLVVTSIAVALPDMAWSLRQTNLIPSTQYIFIKFPISKNTNNCFLHHCLGSGHINNTWAIFHYLIHRDFEHLNSTQVH